MAKHGVGATRVAEIFEIALGGTLTTAVCKVKVVERSGGSYLAFPNIAVVRQGIPEWTSGSGPSVEEALDDCLYNLFKDLDVRKMYPDSEIAWSDPRDF